ncbi:MAG TPA: hypothetical protein DCM51_01350 [Actinobacteria bacterium]|jgi:hypothetical protein|nr:hypothetical protein [Actinomycetota bacterium]
MATKDFNTATLTAKVLYANVLTTTTGTGDAIYTVSANRCAKVQTLTLTSTSGSAINVDVYVVPSGATAGNQHKIVNTYSLASGDSLSLKDYVAGLMLGEGDTIYCKAATGSVINAILTGVEGA